MMKGAFLLGITLTMLTFWPAHTVARPHCPVCPGGTKCRCVNIANCLPPLPCDGPPSKRVCHCIPQPTPMPKKSTAVPKRTDGQLKLLRPVGPRRPAVTPVTPVGPRRR